jgi:predicted permease
MTPAGLMPCGSPQEVLAVLAVCGLGALARRKARETRDDAEALGWFVFAYLLPVGVILHMLNGRIP